MVDGQENDVFCPLIKGNCRHDCVWADHQYELDDDGITHHVYCAVNGIYSLLLSMFTDDTFSD